MIDVHCHLLPGLDHGEQSVDEAAGPRLGQARDLARRLLGEKANALVEDNPARVLNDELILLAPPAEPLPSGWRRLLDRLLGRNA